MDDDQSNKLQTESIELKIIVIGNAGTGKTSFCCRWTKDQFNDNYMATIMTDFSFKMFEYKSKMYRISLWDIAGQDKNIHLSKLFAKNAHGVIVMSDVTNKSSLEAADLWKNEIDSNNLFVDGNKMPCLLIQNKVDLIEDEENFEIEKIEKYAQDNNYINVFCTSAKTGLNINEAMEYFIQHIADRLEEYKNKGKSSGKNTNTNNTNCSNEDNQIDEEEENKKHTIKLNNQNIKKLEDDSNCNC
ncbi:MAG: GTP-binding protein [archaeon]|nr:GTP-binding protein [archaeon]